MAKFFLDVLFGTHDDCGLCILRAVYLEALCQLLHFNPGDGDHFHV